MERSPTDSRYALDGRGNVADRRSLDTHRRNLRGPDEIWKMLLLPGDKWLWLMLGTAGAALAMLGPGLWSVDARLYGWKRLEPTPRKRNNSLS